MIQECILRGCLYNSRIVGCKAGSLFGNLHTISQKALLRMDRIVLEEGHIYFARVVHLEDQDRQCTVDNASCFFVKRIHVYYILCNCFIYDSQNIIIYLILIE